MWSYHVNIHGADHEAMADLARVHHVDVCGQTLANQDTGHRVSALADEEDQALHSAAITRRSPRILFKFFPSHRATERR
jgi:hypothetical protein